MEGKLARQERRWQCPQDDGEEPTKLAAKPRRNTEDGDGRFSCFQGGHWTQLNSPIFLLQLLISIPYHEQGM